MKKKLLRWAVASIIAVSSFGVFTTATTRAQCGCSCTVTCPNNCDFQCSGCGLFEWVEVAGKCCADEKKNVSCPAN